MKTLTIYGIDFSGAKDAGNKIWISKAVPAKKTLLIKECFKARDLPDSGKSRDKCLKAIVRLIRDENNAVFGFDFPFGLPRDVMEEKKWNQLIRDFDSFYKSPEASLKLRSGSACLSKCHDGPPMSYR